MVGRVLLDVNGMRVSAPGFEVTTASAENLVFNSNRGKYFSPWIKGTITASNFSLIFDTKVSEGSSLYVGYYEAVVNFGTTLSYVPVALAMYLSNIGPTNGQWLSSYYMEATGANFNQQLWIAMRAETSRLVFGAHCLKNNAGYLPMPTTISYVVGRF